MTATRILHTQGDVIEAFGGPGKFAARFRTARTAPYNYRKGVALPPRLLYAVVAACGMDGYQLGPSLSQRIDPDVLAGIATYHARSAEWHVLVQKR